MNDHYFIIIIQWNTDFQINVKMDIEIPKQKLKSKIRNWNKKIKYWNPKTDIEIQSFRQDR